MPCSIVSVNTGAMVAAVVIAPHEEDVLAADAVAVAAGLFEPAPAEVAHNPEVIIDLNALVDRVDERVVVALHGLVGEAEFGARVGAARGHFLARHERPLTVLDDVAVAEVRIGREPGLHGAPVISYQ
jgi:hypothetical protein